MKLVNKKNLIIIVSILISLIVIGMLIAVLGDSNGSKIFIKRTTTTTSELTTVPVKKLNVVNPESNSRNVAVMVNNIKNVWGYQSGLQDAYIVYEIIAEGGISRLMALFKDKAPERIGSIRSSRIYYLDYALENDAIYVHIGGSKEALSDIKKLGINDLQSEVTWRERNHGLAYEHTAFASMEKIQNKIKSRGFRNTTTRKLLLNYSIDEVDLSSLDGSIVANDIYIQYSGSKSTSFKYDAENKVYLRSQNDNPHIDYVTKKQYTVKNIITYQVTNKSYDSYGRQTLSNIGTGSGYYITDGYAVPITWEKKTRDGQTVYKYLNGEEINVNDGNTHIQIQPTGRTLTIS